MRVKNLKSLDLLFFHSEYNSILTLPHLITGGEDTFCSSSSFWHSGLLLLLLLRFGILDAHLHLLCLRHLTSQGFKESFSKLVHQSLEERTEWAKNSTPIQGMVAIGGSYGLGG